jgi:hypothetical protein
VSCGLNASPAESEAPGMEINSLIEQSLIKKRERTIDIGKYSG